MREIKVEAKTTKQAIEKGLKELGLSREDVEIEIVREEKKGLLGIGTQNACVIIREKLWKKENEYQQEKIKEIKLEQGFVPSDNILEDTKKVFSEILTRSNVDFKILEAVYDSSKNSVYINFQSKDAGLLLYDGAKGLLSLQQIISAIINRNTDKKIVVKIDTEEFWNKTENKLKRDVEHAIEFIKRTKKPYRMKPMNSMFRKIIHDIVKEHYPDYTTFSSGHARFRRVVIKYNNLKSNNEVKESISEKPNAKEGENNINQNVQPQ